MSTTTVSQCPTSRPAVDVLVEKFARGLLHWTDQRSRAAEDKTLRLAEGHGVRNPRDMAYCMSSIRDHQLTLVRSAGPFAR